MSLIGATKAIGLGTASRGTGRSANKAFGNLTRACLLLPFLSCGVQAQVGAPATVGPLLAYATVSVRPVLEEFPSNAGSVETTGGPDMQPEPAEVRQPLNRTITADSFTFTIERRFAKLSRASRHNSILEGDEVVLFRKKMTSHYNYPSWARLDSGYGQWFNGADPIGRTRTGGVGVRDPDWLYVKMTFSF
jgi:hypothetical protein